jgi:hypothetical protein
MWLAAGALAQDGSAGCGPIDSGTVTDQPGTTITIDQGRLQDNDVSLAWRLYDPWDAGACLELVFTNVGGTIETWQFDVTLDRPITETTYGGPNPDKISIVLDELRLLPTGSSRLEPFGTVTYPLCLEPEVRPIALEAVVDRGQDSDQPEETDVAPDVDRAFGWMLDDAGAIQLTWLEQDTSDDEFCLSLRFGNLTDQRLTDWRMRVRFDNDVVFTEYDTAFFWFHVDLDEVEILPTAGTDRFDPGIIHSGTACFEGRAEPISLVALYTPVTPTSGAGAAPPPPVDLVHTRPVGQGRAP